jgi:hypothetical protein
MGTAVQGRIGVRPHPAVLGHAAVRRAASVLSLVAAVGLPLGALWAWLAPPEFVARSPRATTPGGVLPFVGQSAHRFDDMATFVLFGLAAGILTGAVLWSLRWRCPLAVVSAAIGSLLAAWVAARVGLWLAADLAATGAPFPRPPVLESGWVVVAQPFGVAISYCLAAAWNVDRE